MLYKIILTLIFIICSTSFSQILYETKLTAPDGNDGDFFGVENKIIGNELIIGANKYDYIQQNKGAIYIYEFNGSNWDFNEIIICPSNKQGAHFGISMAVDDTLMFIGATRDTSGEWLSGVVYVYRKLNQNWVLDNKIIPTGASNGASFGSAIDLNADMLLIGAATDYGIEPFSGTAYLFEKIGTDWVQKEKIIGYDALQSYEYGHSVAISGNYLFVGAPQATDFGSNSGAVYLYKIKNDSVHFVKKLISSNVTAEYRFGDEISADSNRVVISAEGSIFAQNYRGSVYIYELEGNQWIEKTQVFPFDASAYHFGSSVKLKGDSLLIGAVGHIEVGDTGKGYLYIKDQTEWRQIYSFQASDGNNVNFMGNSCDMGNGFIVFGAPGQESNTGAAYVYSKHPTGIDDLNPPELDDFILYQNYPNPFNPTTTIRFTISDLRFTILKVYDVLGNEITTLVNEEKPAGYYEVKFNAANLTSGVYFYTLTSGTFVSTKKLILLK